MKPFLWIFFCFVLAGFARIQNRSEVFLGEQVFFTDADCYSRMTRVRILCEQGGAPVRHHRFENFPEGVDSHATAPLDYLIVGFGRMLGGFGGGGKAMEWAGAWVGPILGVLSVLFFGVVAVSSGIRSGWTGAFFFAVSPVLVHGTDLGRPDHQSLLILLLVVGLGSEWILAKTSEQERHTRVWCLVGGLAFGLAFWVSLYEPVVLLALTALAWGIAAPARILIRDRLWWVGGFLGMLGCAFAVEGAGFFGMERLQAAGEHWVHLKRWGATIGELGGVHLVQVLGWLGWALIGGPVLCVLRWRDRSVWGVAVGLLVLLLLTLWQARWGYFLCAVWALVLPEVLAPLRKQWVICVAFLASLWPLAWEWDGRIDPDGPQARVRLERLREAFLLREMAEAIRSGGGGAFLAPWWHSPALAYWSGADGVAGSSHESIAGIVDTSRFYLGADTDAEQVLKKRGVQWVLADDPERVAGSAGAILDQPVPPRSLAFRLMRESAGVSGYRLRAQNDFFKLFAVEPGRMER